MAYTLTDRVPGMLKVFIVIVAVVGLGAVFLERTVSTSEKNIEHFKQFLRTRVPSQSRSAQEQRAFYFERKDYEIKSILKDETYKTHNTIGNARSPELSKTPEKVQDLGPETQKYDTQIDIKKETIQSDDQKQNAQTDSQEQVADDGKVVSEKDDQAQSEQTNNGKQTEVKDEQQQAGHTQDQKQTQHKNDPENTKKLDDKKQIEDTNQKQTEQTDSQEQTDKTGDKKQTSVETNKPEHTNNLDNIKEIEDINGEKQRIAQNHTEQTDGQKQSGRKDDKKQAPQTDKPENTKNILDQKQPEQTNDQKQTDKKDIEKQAVKKDSEKQIEQTGDTQQPAQQGSEKKTAQADNQNKVAETDIYNKKQSAHSNDTKQNNVTQHNTKDNGKQNQTLQTKKHDSKNETQTAEAKQNPTSQNHNKTHSAETNEKGQISKAIEQNQTSQTSRQNLAQENKAVTTARTVPVKTKYLIYLCDKTRYCYGLGDRQRAIASVYYLAELTNRRFGIIMTSPTDIRDFYEPNLVDWDIPSSDFPPNATTKEILALGPDVNLHLDIIDFNVEHQEDIIYMRTNQVFWHTLLLNPVYRSKIPQWARIHKSNLLPVAWLRLMQPTTLLRGSLNSALIDIAKEIQEEESVWNSLDGSSCCLPSSLQKVPVCEGVKPTVCDSKMATVECCYEYNVANFGCADLRNKCPFVNSTGCASKLGHNFTSSEEVAQSYCTKPRSTSTYKGSTESIGQMKGYNISDMNLVCAHIRLGDWKSFKGNYKFNSSHYMSLWNFFQSFSKKGHHIYLASDSQPLKDEAKAIFGKRLHVVEQKIQHLAYVKGQEEAKAGMLFALTEQLMLTTSCSELLISHSTFSIRAMEFRKQLMKTGRVYKFNRDNLKVA